jgi:hypothetical protein
MAASVTTFYVVHGGRSYMGLLFAPSPSLPLCPYLRKSLAHARPLHVLKAISERSPSIWQNFSNFGRASGSVKMSASISSVGMYMIVILLASTTSQTYWCCTSMCFVPAWFVLSFASDFAPWLSQKMAGNGSSDLRKLRHSPSLAVACRP